MVVKKHRQLNEDNNWSVLRNPAPFRIGRAPNPVFNDDEKLKINYLLRKAEEAATFTEQARVVGQMEQIKPQLADLYRDITSIRNFIEGQKKEPLATKKHLEVMDKMIAVFDKMNETLTNDVFELCDQLVVDDDEGVEVFDMGEEDDLEPSQHFATEPTLITFM